MQHNEREREKKRRECLRGGEGGGRQVELLAGHRVVATGNRPTQCKAAWRLLIDNRRPEAPGHITRRTRSPQVESGKIRPKKTIAGRQTGRISPL